MNFDPDTFPGEYPAEWYDEYPGKIVGHVSLLRDMLEGEYSDLTGEIDIPDHLVPKVCFSLGSWIDGEWVNGISGGSGFLLGLHEDGDMPTVIVGTVELYDELLDDPTDCVVVERADIKEIPLDKIGFIIGLAAPPEHWENNSN